MTMPAIFFGHGNPMNALLDNEFSTAWKGIGRALPRPQAALCISAHWYIEGTAVTAMPMPRTIHDFGGFPDELFAVEYPAAGDPALAERVRNLLSPVTVAMDRSWGLDHGTWSVLVHVFPDADIPIVQLSIDRDQEPDFHYRLGQALAPLRDEGVLIVGSGNLVHNLHAYAWGRHCAEPLDWAARFDTLARELIERGDDRSLVDYEALGADARLSIPTPEHYLPLLYVLGARRPDDAVSFPVAGIDGGSVSMLSVRVG